MATIPAVPYRGIDPFRYLDHAIFFARGAESERLASLVSVYRGVMLYGDSGSGKSSLINAGLLPEAIQRGFAPERLRVQPRAGEELVLERIAAGEHGDELLPSVLVGVQADAPARSVMAIEEFEHHVQAASQEHRLLLIFDQFEEIITLFDGAGDPSAQGRLVEALVRLLRGPLAVKILFSFREDYLGRVKELLSQCPELVDQALRLAPPAADALPTIIRGPFDGYPGHFDHELSPAVAGQLVAALARRFGSGEISLSEVQTVCLRLWQSDDPETLLAQKGPQGLLEDYLGEALAGLPDHLQPASIALLSQMVTAAGTRNVISAEDLIARVREQDGGIAPDLLLQALDRLSGSRLVRRERRRDLYLYELTSEFLVPWISQRRDELARLQARRRERRRVLILGSIVAALAIIATGVALLAAWAISQRSHARSEAVTADRTARSLALAYAQARLGTRLDVGLLLSLEASKPFHGSPLAAAGARSSLIASLQALEPAREAGAVGILHGHTGPVLAVAFSPSGTMLASAGDDRTIRLWDSATHRQIGVLTGSRDSVTSVAFSPDGRTLASGSKDNTIQLWDVATRHQRGRPLAGNGDTINSVAFSPDGRLLASAGDDRTVRLWDVAGHRQVSVLTGSRDAVTSVAFSPDGRLLASGSRDNQVRVWDVATHRQLGDSLTGHTNDVETVAFSPDGRTLASGGDDDTVRVWNVSTGQEIGAPLHTDGSIDAVAFSRDGRHLAAGSSANTVLVWNLAGGGVSHPQTLPGHTGTVYGVAFSPDGRILASASYDDTVMLWDVAHRHLGELLTGHRQAVYDAAFSPDGRMLASASADRTIRLWDVATHRQVGTPLTGDRDAVDRVAFSPDGRTLASAGADATVRLWDVASHRELGRPLTGHDEGVASVAFSPDGHTLASASADKTIRFWGVADRRPLGGPLRADSVGVLDVAFSRDGRTLASGGGSGAIRLWDVATRRELGAPLIGHAGPVYDLAFSPDGRTLASAGEDHTVRLWDLATRRQLGAPLTGHTDAVYGVAFSPDGRTLASAANDNTVRLWDVATHVPLGTPLQRPDTVFSVAFSPDGRLLASAGGDNVIGLSTGLFWPNLASLKREVCTLVGSGLTRVEWSQYAPGIPFTQTCG